MKFYQVLNSEFLLQRDYELADCVSLIPALKCVPPADIMDGFMHMVEHKDFSAEAEYIVKYLENSQFDHQTQFEVCAAVYAVEVCSVYQ